MVGGRDTIYYEQLILNKWKSIEVESEILLGKKRRVICFKNEIEWLEYPKWAANRDEIINRIKIDFPQDKYLYENDY